MAEEGELKDYELITEEGKKKTSSKGYTGRALANYPNGETYEGEYAEGNRSGTGVYRYKTGEKYEGEWIKNRKHGIGKMTYFKEGASLGDYNGYWENGRRHGEGVFRYPNGDVYSGWWKHGQKEGTGTYTFKKTGHKLFGDWEAGKIVKGKWIYPEGLQFSGDFANNKPNGLGEWLFKNGNKAGGSYVQTKKEWTDDEVQALKDAGKIAEDAEPPAVYDIAWVPSSNISESAELVNKVPE